MNPVRFIFCLHIHQPIGNFDEVNEQAYAQSYLPFIDLAQQYSEFAFSLHVSGCLFEWLEAHHPEYLEKLRALVERKQVEILAGAMYEPILPVWPEEHIRAQILAHRAFTMKWFGENPQVLWLPERVWEPTLATPLARLGIRGLPLDDTQLKAAGVTGSDLLAPWQCNTGEVPLKIFPISESLRYKIPFAPVHESLAELEAAHDARPGALVTYGDDGEKLGSWPHTFRHVYTDGWLKRFIESILSAKFVQLSHFKDSLDAPAKSIELPPGTYPEMLEWSRQAGDGTIPASLNPWRNFLTKYSEAGRLSQMLQDFSSADTPSPHLLRAECNCAYWHGVFGGVYLPHLRSALFEEWARSRAETPADGIVIRSGKAVTCLSTRDLDLGLQKPGGTLNLLLQHDPPFNWGCTLTRRPEFYHHELAQAKSAYSRKPQSVHSVKGVHRAHWSKWLAYDAYERASLLDHFLLGKVRLGAFAESRLSAQATFVRQDYELVEGKNQITLSATGEVGAGTTSAHAQIVKTIRPSGAGAFLVSYSVSCGAAFRGHFGVEWNLTALAPTGPDRWLEVNGRAVGEPKARGVHLDVTQFAIVDQWGGKAIYVEWDKPGSLVHFGLHTVSQSERDYELVYQQTAFLAHWPLPRRGPLSIAFQVRTESLP